VVINDAAIPGVLTGSMVELILANSLRNPKQLPVVMIALANASNGSHEGLYKLVAKYSLKLNKIAIYFSTLCSDLKAPKETVDVWVSMIVAFERFSSKLKFRKDASPFLIW
jgi:hypothetical protein